MSGGAKALSGDRQLRLTACHLSSFSFTKQWPPAHPSPLHQHPPTLTRLTPVPHTVHTKHKRSLPRSLLQGSEKISVSNSLTQTNVIIFSLSTPADTHQHRGMYTRARRVKRFTFPLTNLHTEKVISGLGLHSPGGLWSCHTHTNTRRKRQSKSS